MSQLSDKKRYEYWSPKEGCVIANNKFSIKILKITIRQNYNVVTLLSLTDQFGQKQKISHNQYTTWPEDNFFHKPDAFIDFYCNVKDMYHQLENQTADKKIAPILVQCLDGIVSSAVFYFLTNSSINVHIFQSFKECINSFFFFWCIVNRETAK